MLEGTKNKPRPEEELNWMIKSRATWIYKGDSNTKFLHNYASHHKQKKVLYRSQKMKMVIVSTHLVI